MKRLNLKRILVGVLVLICSACGTANAAGCSKALPLYNRITASVKASPLGPDTEDATAAYQNLVTVRDDPATDGKVRASVDEFLKTELALRLAPNVPNGDVVDAADKFGQAQKKLATTCDWKLKV
jgi:hypothetical protein